MFFRTKGVPVWWSCFGGEVYEYLQTIVQTVRPSKAICKRSNVSHLLGCYVCVFDRHKCLFHGWSQLCPGPVVQTHKCQMHSSHCINSRRPSEVAPTAKAKGHSSSWAHLPDSTDHSFPYESFHLVLCLTPPPHQPAWPSFGRGA